METNLTDLKNSKHFCILPWVHVRIETSGKVSPCCRVADLYSFGNLKEKTLEEIWNGPAIREMRLGLLNNNALPQCRGCTNVEGPNFPLSHRQMHNKMFEDAFDRIAKTEEDGFLETNELLFLDLRFSNLCNFRCRTCVPAASSAWYGDSNKLDRNSFWKDLNRPTRSRDELWALIEKQIPHLRKIYFAGGEPLLEEDHYLLLEKLIEMGRTKVNIAYNSNLSRLSLQNRSVLELWKKFETVSVAASFDGIGVHAELLRKGTRWNELEENFEAIRNTLPAVRLKIFPTVSAMNAFHLPLALDHWINLGWVKEAKDFHLNIVLGPKRINLNILSLNEREKLRKHYADFVTSLSGRELKKSLVDYVKSQLELVLSSFSNEVWEKSRNEFRVWTRELDKIRDEKFLDLFPELEEVFMEAHANAPVQGPS